MSWPGQHEHNWGQPDSYGGGHPYPPPGGPPPPPPSGGGGGALAVLLVVLAVVVLVGGVGSVLVLSADREPLPTTTARVPTAPETSPTAQVPAASTIRPRIAGWQGVPARNHGIAYDVPKTWEVLTPTTVVGFEDAEGKPLVGMSGAAGVERGECTLVRTGVSGGAAPEPSGSAGLSALPRAARSVALRWAGAGYTPDRGRPPTVRLTRPKGVKLGGIRGYHVAAQVTVNGTRGACDPPRAMVHTVAFPSAQGDPIVFVGFADLGVPGALGDAGIRKAISSIRPLR